MGDAPQIIIIAGPNGAGKSTLAPLLLRDTFGLMEFVNADTIALGLSGFQPETAAFEAGRIMLKRLRGLSEQGASFAFESALASRSYAPWINRLREQGYSFHLFFLWLRSPELAIRRVQERMLAGGHGIPEDVIRRRYQKGIRNFFEIYCKLAKTWAVYDNSISGPLILLATGTAGEEPFVYQVDLWNKFHEAAQWQ